MKTSNTVCGASTDLNLSSRNETMPESKGIEVVGGSFAVPGVRLARRILRLAVASAILASAPALHAAPAPAGYGELVGDGKQSPPAVEPAARKRVVSSLAATQPLPPPTPAEQRCGVQVLRVTVAAAGGLVDLRLKVLDAAKARQRIMDPANPPLLIPEGTVDPLTASRYHLRNLRFADGIANYILYPNVHNAVKPGDKVVVALGGERLDPVTVR